MHDEAPIFSIVPIEVWQDKRLRLETLRVLGALLSFRGKHTNTVWPSRQAIKERCGMPVAKVSEATSDLERLGWVTKEGRGGFSKATRYTITVPEIVTDPGTVTQSVRVTEQGTGGVTEQGTGGVTDSGTGMGVTDSGTGKELTKNIPTEQKEVAQRPPSSLVCPVEMVVEAYHRNMPNNPRCKVLNNARREAIKARWKEAAKLTCKPFGYTDQERGLEAWEEFFATCAESLFLTGRAEPRPGKPPFFADIDFLMMPSKFAGCLENKYHRGMAA